MAPLPIIPNVSNAASVIGQKGESDHGKGQDKISWNDFLKIHVSKAVEELAPQFENDFKSFGRKNEVHKNKFMQARILYAILRDSGLWGFQFSGDKNLSSAPVLLRQIADAAFDDEGAVLFNLFLNDCENIAFLYSEIAATLGLKGVEVRRVQFNHVNIFVPIGNGVTLRMDLTGLGDDLGSPPWDLPANTFIPDKNDPQIIKYDKNILEVRNKYYRRGEAMYAKQLGSLLLDQKSAARLIERLQPPAAISGFVAVPPKWSEFVRGAQYSQKCYEKFLQKYSYATVSEAAKAIQDEDRNIRQNGDEIGYFSCLEEPSLTNLERLGRLFDYLQHSACFYFPPELESVEETDPMVCSIQWANFNEELHSVERKFHSTLLPVTAQEIEAFGKEMDVLESLDPKALVYPSGDFSVSHWQVWARNYFKYHSHLLTALGALSHVVESHSAE
ncbi:MAG: hypothetical protein Q7T03_03870 [Deltaproteobacteria bacterium]|nr:hypothetical protein [Deltaproteobacteria bacterium]